MASFLNRLLFPELSVGPFVQDGYLWPLSGLCLYVVLVAATYPFLFRLMRRMSSHLLTPTRTGFWPSLCVPPVLFYLWIFLTPNDLFYGWIITSATALMLVLLLCVAFFSLQNLTWVAELEEKTTPPDPQKALSREACAVFNEKLQSSEMLLHDFRHHLLVLKKLLDDDDLGPANHLLQNLLDETETAEPILTSGNYLIDTLVNGRLGALSEKGVAVSAQASVPDILPLDYNTLSPSLLAVLNTAAAACEAASPCSESELTLSLDYSRQCLRVVCTFPGTQPLDTLSPDLQALSVSGKCRFECERCADGRTQLSLWLS